MNKLSPVVLWTLWTALVAYILPFRAVFNISHFNIHSQSIWFKIWRKTLGQYIQSQIKQSKLCIFCFSLLKILEVEKEKEKISRSRRGEKFASKTRTLKAGLHKLWYPSIRDTSTWSKFGARGEHGDVFLFSNLGALWELNQIFIACLFKGSQEQNCSFEHSYLRHFSWMF